MVCEDSDVHIYVFLFLSWRDTHCCLWQVVVYSFLGVFTIIVEIYINRERVW